MRLGFREIPGFDFEMKKAKTCQQDTEASQHVIRQDLFDFYKAEKPDSAVIRLIEQHRLAVWHSDTEASVVFAMAPTKELEEVLAEIAMLRGGGYRIDSDGRNLDGMSFRAEDCQGQNYYVLALADGMCIENGISVLSHEAVHTAVKLLNDHRLTLDTDPDGGNAEPLAYLVGTLVSFGLETFWPDTFRATQFDPIEKMIVAVGDGKRT